MEAPGGPVYEVTEATLSMRRFPILEVGSALSSVGIVWIQLRSGAVLPGSALVVLGGALAGVSLLRGKRWRRRAALRAGGWGVFLDGELFVPKEEISAAFVQSAEGRGFEVVLERSRGAPLEISVPGVAAGELLLRALGMDYVQTVLYRTVGVKSRWSRLPSFLIVLGFVIALAWTATVASMFGVVVLFSLVASGIVALRDHLSRVTVGAEGLRVQRPLGRDVFLRYDRVLGIIPIDKEIEVRMRDGSRVTLRFLKTADASKDLVRRLEDALQAHRASSAGENVEALIARGGRSTEEWMAALRDLAKEASYRAASVSAESLWRILESPRAAWTARAGAAATLAPSLDGDGRARLRVAAQGCAEPRLRVALEAAADSSDAEAMEAALLHVDEEPEALPTLERRAPRSGSSR